MNTQSYYKIALVAVILAVVFAGAVFIIYYVGYMDEHASPSVPSSSVLPAAVPTPVPTAVPTPAPVQTPGTQKTGPTVYTNQLAKVPEGDLFDLADDTGFAQQHAAWKTASTLKIPSAPWTTYQVTIGVTPAQAPLSWPNGGTNAITIAYPWRIKWEIAGSQDTDPYSNAEFILMRPDGTIVDTFGWKGNYRSAAHQTTAEYQPGDYVLAVYLRGCGAVLEFQQCAGPVFFETAAVTAGGAA